jgi:hypothetical protein
MSLRPGALFATIALTLGAAQLGHADDQDRADKLNKEGNKLLYEERYQEAIEKYKQAIILSQQGKYYFNLCAAYSAVGEFGLALQACDAVAAAGADATLSKRTAELTTDVEAQIRALGRDPNEVRGGGGGTYEGRIGSDDPDRDPDDPFDPEDPDDRPPPVDTAEFRGQPLDLFKPTPPSHEYTWTLGGSLFAGGINIAGKENSPYASGGGGFRLHADYMALPAMNVGIQGHLGFIGVGENPDSFQKDSLSIVEVGASAYMHVRCAGRMCITPLAGLMLAGFQPEDTMTNEVRYMGMGLRAEVGLSWAFGPRFEHVISVIPALGMYLPPVGSYQDRDPDAYGLDGVSTAFTLGIGYTHRFNTPFGTAAFITLE